MNCDYWGDYMWEVVAFVIIIVIGIFYLIGTYFGAGAVILVIGAIVFGFYKFLHFGDTAEEESEYVENALKFIEFTKRLNSPLLTLFATPKHIGVVLSDDALGICVQMCLATTSDARLEKARRDLLEKELVKHIDGNNGLQLYRVLCLDVDLWKHDEDHPIILKYLLPPYNRARSELQQLDTYINALKRRYKKQYQKELKIVTWIDYK